MLQRPMLVVSALALALAACGTPTEGEPLKARQAPTEEKVTCDANDLVMEVTREPITGEGDGALSEDPAPPSPEAALEAFFDDHDASQIPVDEFERNESTGASKDKVELVHKDKENNKTDAILEVQQIGKGWGVIEAEICNQFIKKYQK